MSQRDQICCKSEFQMGSAASLGSSTLKAAKVAGFVKNNVPDTSLAVDHKKIERSKQRRVMKTCEDKP